MDPLNRDTDGDTVLDGSECALESDPTLASSAPARFPAGDSDRDGLTDTFEESIGTNPALIDTDGDRLVDGLEYRYYGSNPLTRNGDGDQCPDGMEVGSINADIYVNAFDLVFISRAFSRAGTPAYVLNFDLDRNGTINVVDLATAATMYGYCLRPAF
jgi:hypothetical protein